MTDWLGVAFILLLAAGGFLGLRRLSRPESRTEEEFERSADGGASLLGAGVAALQGILDPADQRSKIEIAESRQGRYQKRSVAGELDLEIKTGAPGNSPGRTETNNERSLEEK